MPSCVLCGFVESEVQVLVVVPLLHDDKEYVLNSYNRLREKNRIKMHVKKDTCFRAPLIKIPAVSGVSDGQRTHPEYFLP